MPNVFKKIHKSVIDPKIMRGNFISERKHRNLICKTKSNNLQPLMITVKINENVSDRGIEYVGVLNFKVEDSITKNDLCLVILDKEGIIRDLSLNAAIYFKEGDEAVTYIEELDEIFEVKFILFCFNCF